MLELGNSIIASSPTTAEISFESPAIKPLISTEFLSSKYPTL